METLQTYATYGEPRAASVPRSSSFLSNARESMDVSLDPPLGRIAVVIPTLNERDNITGVIQQLQVLLQNRLEVVVVDDNSSDGTARAVQELAAQSPNIHLVKRPTKQGIGSAVREGILFALSNTDCVLVASMDADWSHDPRELSHLIAASKDADLVQGSRYVTGSAIVDWPMYRRILSRAGNTLCRVLLHTKLKEHTTFFRVWKRECAIAVMDRGRENGYVWGIESLLIALDGGFIVKEVPITFSERQNGHSKLGPVDMARWFSQVLRLSFLRTRRSRSISSVASSRLQASPDTAQRLK